MTDRPTTYQTVRLRRGKHESPESGVCVVELASMLAGEPFSDRPASVCRVIAGFLRSYNDALDDERRQDLYPIAAAVVGTATADDDVIARRIRLVADWGRVQAARRRRRRHRFLPHPRFVSFEWAPPGEIGHAAVCAARRVDDATHASALALVDRLIGLGATGCPSPEPAPVAAVPA